MKKQISLFLLAVLLFTAFSFGGAQSVSAADAPWMPGADVQGVTPSLDIEYEYYFEFTCTPKGFSGLIFVPAFKTAQLTWKTNYDYPISFVSSDPSRISVNDKGKLTSKELNPFQPVSIMAYVNYPDGTQKPVGALSSYSLFTDVIDTTVYYFMPVYNAVSWGVTSGYTDSHNQPTGKFGPEDTCTRGQIATFLYRAYRYKFTPDTSGVSGFKDVKSTAYYADAVKWAVALGVTGGYTDKNGKPTGYFGPEDGCTRAQVVTFLYRLLRKEIPADTSSVSDFKDVKKGAYYYDAVKWAVAAGITTGYSGTGKFGPDDICTRAQVVTFIARAVHITGRG